MSRYTVANQQSQELFRQAQNLIPGGVNSPVRAFKNVDGDPFFTREGKGSKITDVDGNEYTDYIGTWGPAILGHAPGVVVDAVYEAAKKGTSYGTPTENEVLLAQKVVDWVPSVEKVRMVSSGTEATMSAIRLARGYTGRDKIIKFDGCYHGHVDSLLVAAGSGALTHGEPDSAGIPKSFAEQTIILPYNKPEAVEAAFAKYGDQIAAIIVESFPANAGLVFPRMGYLELLRSVTKKHGALLIFDEVMTGFRVAKGGIQERVKLDPDLTAMGKVIGGGLPVGAFGGKAEIMNCLAPLGSVYQAGTLSGNPVAMAAGLAQLNEMDRSGGYGILEARGDQLAAGVRSIYKDLGVNWSINQIGSMFCMYFTEEEIINVDSVMKCDQEKFTKFFWSMLNKGFYVAPSLYETGFISTSHSEEDINRTLNAMEDSLKKIV